MLKELRSQIPAQPPSPKPSNLNYKTLQALKRCVYRRGGHKKPVSGFWASGFRAQGLGGGRNKMRVSQQLHYISPSKDLQDRL